MLNKYQGPFQYIVDNLLVPIKASILLKHFGLPSCNKSFIPSAYQENRRMYIKLRPYLIYIKLSLTYGIYKLIYQFNSRLRLIHFYGGIPEIHNNLTNILYYVKYIFQLMVYKKYRIFCRKILKKLLTFCDN